MTDSAGEPASGPRPEPLSPSPRRCPPRFLAVHLPQVSIDRVRRRGPRSSAADGGPEHVHLVVQVVASRQVVVQACGGGRASGIASGMNVAQARTLVPGAVVHLHEHRPDLDRRLLSAVARWLMRFTPRVAVDAPDGLLLDLTGCERLHGDEHAVLARVHAGLRGLGLLARGAIAGTVGAAWAVARHAAGDVMVVAGGQEAAALDPLPVAALRIDGAVIDELAQVGIERIGQLRRVPRAELAGRGGGWREHGLLARLDQAFGTRPERIEPISPPVRPRFERIFAGPVMQPEAIVLAMRDLVEQLVVALEGLECGVLRLQVECRCPDVASQRFEVRFGQATRRRRHLWSMLAPRLERVHLDHGVDSIHLEAMRIARIRDRQIEDGPLSAAVPEPGIGGTPADGARATRDAAPATSAAMGELIDTLVDRLGPDRVLGMRATESHVPEQTGEPFPLVEHGWPAASVSRPAASGVAPPPSPSHRWRHAADPQGPGLGSPAHRRPPLLLRVPEPLEVPDAGAVAASASFVDSSAPPCTLPGSVPPPSRIRWRGEEHLLVAAIGPERLSAPWWEARRLAGGGRGADPGLGLLMREYYRVQDAEGRWWWIFHRLDASAGDRPSAAEGRRWFMHGSWD